MFKLMRRALQVFAVILFVCIIAPKHILSAPSHPNVLLLNSYSREMKWTDNQVQGIISTFHTAGVEANFYIEYLDWKRYPTNENLSDLYLLYRNKYSKQPIDIIMTTDDAALRFALSHRKDLFSDAPIVFSGVYPESASKLTQGHQRVTGVQEVMDVNGTIEIMKRFNPNLDHIYLIYDTTESGLAAEAPLMRAVANLNPPVSVSVLPYSTYQDVIEQLSTASGNSAVLMATYSRDGSGVVKELERYVKLYSEHSRVPIYVLYDFELGYGAVGGSVLSGHLNGKITAELALRILSGENPDVVAPVDPNSRMVMLDYQQVIRYRLPLDQIPSGSEVLNRPQSFYEDHKIVIWTTWSIFCFMGVSIIVLVMNIRKRKAAELSLKWANEEITATYEEVLASQEELQAQYDQLESIQQALSESEERYKLSLEGANDGLWDWDILNDWVFISEHCCALLGIRQRRVKGIKKLLARTGEGNKIVEKLNEHLTGKSAFFICEYRIGEGTAEKRLLCRGKALFEGRRPIRMAGSLTDVTDQRLKEAKIQYLAYHDPLTGLWNRTALHEKLQTILQQSPYCKAGAILFIDIDNFKIVNDTYGHLFGDRLLVALADMVAKVVEDNGFVVRMGGDELVIVLEDASDRKKAAQFADRIMELLVAPVHIENNKIFLTISMGITLYPEDGMTAVSLLKNADLAMYQAKEQGKNQYVFFDFIMESSLRERLHLDRKLRDAIVQEELVLWYQPFIEVETGHIIGFEALLRWQSPDRGIIPPAEFIGPAEKNGLIVPIGKKVLRDACAFLTGLHADGYSNLHVTVNISVAQLVDEGFVQLVENIIKETGVPSQCLGIEITESVFMDHSKLFIEKLQSLKAMGITILLDDFGSGYSSLKYLANLPIDVIKIDKSFIDKLNEDDSEKQLAQVIFALARHMDVKAVAEGVETEKQLAKLSQYRCEFIQGYLFSKPVPADQVRRLLGDAKDYRNE